MGWCSFCALQEVVRGTIREEAPAAIVAYRWAGAWSSMDIPTRPLSRRKGNGATAKGCLSPSAFQNFERGRSFAAGNLSAIGLPFFGSRLIAQRNSIAIGWRIADHDLAKREENFAGRRYLMKAPKPRS